MIGMINAMHSRSDLSRIFAIVTIKSTILRCVFVVIFALFTVLYRQNPHLCFRQRCSQREYRRQDG